MYIKRKVGACSYIDDPIGCQSLLSRAMHKVKDTLQLVNMFVFFLGWCCGYQIILIQVFGLTSLKAPNPCSSGQNGPGSVTVDQLVGTFSSDPSLIAFAQLCCDPSWKSRQVCRFLFSFYLHILLWGLGYVKNMWSGIGVSLRHYPSILLS